MKIRFKNIILIIFIFMVALCTNPKKDVYVNWYKEKTTSQQSNSITKRLISIIGGPLIQSSTTTHNYIFFSIYNTSINKDLKVLGIFNNFIPLN